MNYESWIERRWMRGISERSNLRTRNTVLRLTWKWIGISVQSVMRHDKSLLKKMGSEWLFFHKLYVDVRVQLCAVVEALVVVVVVLC